MQGEKGHVRGHGRHPGSIWAPDLLHLLLTFSVHSSWIASSAFWLTPSYVWVSKMPPLTVQPKARFSTSLGQFSILFCGNFNSSLLLCHLNLRQNLAQGAWGYKIPAIMLSLVKTPLFSMLEKKKIWMGKCFCFNFSHSEDSTAFSAEIPLPLGNGMCFETSFFQATTLCHWTSTASYGSTSRGTL